MHNMPVVQRDSAVAQPNPDMSGIAVVISNIVNSFCHLILLYFSPKSAGSSTYALVIQAYTILISTLGSINRNQLMVIDSICGQQLCLSPMIFELLYSAISTLHSWRHGKHLETSRLHETQLPKTQPHKSPVFACIVLVIIPLFLAASAVTAFSPTAFINSGDMSTTAGEWVRDLVVMALPIALPMNLDPHYGGWLWFANTLFQYLVFLIIVLYILRHLQDSYRLRKVWMHEIQCLSNWERCKLAVKSHWTIISTSHPWIVYLFLLSGLTTWICSPSEILLVTGRGYVFSYGQMLSVSSVILPLLSVLHLGHQNRRGFIPLVRNLPRWFWDGLVFLTTGNRNPWKITYVEIPLTQFLPELSVAALPAHLRMQEVGFMAQCCIDATAMCTTISYCRESITTVRHYKFQSATLSYETWS